MQPHTRNFVLLMILHSRLMTDYQMLIADLPPVTAFDLLSAIP
jgi:hypothetical protein